MRKKGLWQCLFLVCILLQQKSFGQEGKFSIWCGPAFLLEKVAPQVGIGYRFSKLWSLNTGFAYTGNEFYFDKARWIRSNIEIRKHFAKANRYVAFHTSHSWRKFERYGNGSFISSLNNPTLNKYSSAVIHSSILSFDLRLGREWAIGSRYFLGFFAGAGARIVNTKYDAKDVQTGDPYRAPDGTAPIGDEAWKINSSLTRFHMPIGVHFGLRI
jgi:hypothetical protein